jgi:prepilin-type N-terminal cleavage/methylation domain-containing protein
MISAVNRRLGLDEGFTLVELLVVIIVLAILLAIAVPSYLSFKDRANKTAAAANIRELVPSVESYNADNVPNGPNDPDPATSTTDYGYMGMTIALLKSNYDQAIPATDFVNNSGDPEAAGVTAKATLDETHYCVYSQVGNWFAWKRNSDGVIKQSSDSTDVCK